MMQYPGNAGRQQKFGYLPDIDAGESGEEVHDATGAYAGWLSAATSMKASSSSANDASAGTGARTIEVTGLTVSGSSWVETSETVTLNGQTGVDLVNDYIRVYRVKVVTVGTGGVNAGDVYIGSGTITDGVPATKYAMVRTAVGQTCMAVWTVPSVLGNGNNVGGGQILRWYGSVGAGQAAYATLGLQIRASGGSWQTKRIIHVGEGGGIDEVITWGQTVSPKMDVRVIVLANGVNNSSVAAGFDVEMWT